MLMAAVMSQEAAVAASSPLELTTSVAQGISPRSSPEAVCSQPSTASLDDDDVDTIVVTAEQNTQQQQFYAPQHPPQPQKLFDLNQLTEEEKIVLSTSGSARLYQANSQDEIDVIMQQVLDSKTTDTILIVSPIGRQIVTCNENGDQIITRVMATEHSSPEQHNHHRPPGDEMGFHAESPDNPHQTIPGPVIDYSGHQQNAIAERQAVYENGSVHSDQDGSPPQSVIYEKHLTGTEHMEMLNEQALRKPGRDIQDIYAEQQSHLVYDSNNNADSNNPHDQMEGQIMKSGGSGDQEEVMGGMINDKPQMDLIYNDGSKTVIYTPTATVAEDDGEEQQHKPLGMYTTSTADLDTFIDSGNHQMVQQTGLPFEGGAQGSSSVYVVQGGMVHEEEAMNLQSGLR